MHFVKIGGMILFSIGENIVHPMHGAGVIDSVVKKKIDGADREYYVLKLPLGDMRVMVPVDGCEKIGVRHVISRDEAQKVIDAFPEIDISMNQNWNKRYRENHGRIISGDPCEVAQVVKGLMARDMERGLSTGERKMLHSAKQIFISELVISLKKTYEDIESLIAAAVS